MLTVFFFSRLTSAEYHSITKKITDLFPRETPGTYYVPGAKRINAFCHRSPYAQGKLVNKVRNIVKRSEDAVPIRKRKSTEETTSVPSKVTVIDVNDQDLEKNEDYIWLKVHNDPWTNVEEKWNKTYILRRCSNTSITSVEQFIQKWPILKDLRSETLVYSY